MNHFQVSLSLVLFQRRVIIFDHTYTDGNAIQQDMLENTLKNVEIQLITMLNLFNYYDIVRRKRILMNLFLYL